MNCCTKTTLLATPSTPLDQSLPCRAPLLLSTNNYVVSSNCFITTEVSAVFIMICSFFITTEVSVVFISRLLIYLVIFDY